MSSAGGLGGVGGAGSSSSIHISRESVARDVFKTLRTQFIPTAWGFLKHKIKYDEAHIEESLDRLDAFIDENPIEEGFSEKNYNPKRIEAHIQAALKKDPRAARIVRLLSDSSIMQQRSMERGTSAESATRPPAKAMPRASEPSLTEAYTREVFQNLETTLEAKLWEDLKEKISYNPEDPLTSLTALDTYLVDNHVEGCCCNRITEFFTALIWGRNPYDPRIVKKVVESQYGQRRTFFDIFPRLGAKPHKE